MQVCPSFSMYLSAVNRDPSLSTNNEIQNFIKENSQRFTYGAVDYPTYEGKYRPNGYIPRKIIAIPAALWAGVVKSIYHLSIVIFSGIPKAYAGESRVLKANVYRVVRDMEEALGWLVILFNDKRGSYLVQESLFQKECYNYYEAIPKKVVDSGKPFSSSFYSSRTFIDGVEIVHHDEAVKITLRDFRGMNAEAQQAAIKKFRLQYNIQLIGQEQFFQKLNEASEQALQLVNLVDLMLDVRTSKIKYALLSDEEFQKVTIRQLQHASEEQIHMISQRIGDTKVLSSHGQSYDNILELPVVHFYRISGQLLSKAIDTFPPNVLALVTDSQIENLNLAYASSSQVNRLFSGMGNIENQRRFALLTSEQVQAILEKLGEDQLNLVTEEHLRELDLSNLAQEKLQALFRYRDRMEHKRRFACLSDQQVKAILPKLGEFQYKLISDEQLVSLDLAALSSDLLRKIFCFIDGKEEKRRFALLDSNQVQAILGKLGESQMKLISDEQLQELVLSDLSQDVLNKLFRFIDGKVEKRRFACVPVQQVQAILGKLGDFQLKLISEEQIQELDLSKLSERKKRILLSNHSKK